MYGLVNQSFRDMMVQHHGTEAWSRIQLLSGVEHELFISTLPYEDNLTYELIGAAVEVTGIGVNELLESFGIYWILNTGKNKYGELMRAGGNDFSEFMMNLPRFHDRVIMIYPAIKPPEFQLDVEEDGRFVLDYYSERQGLTWFVIGLIKGIAKMFDQNIEVVLVRSENTDCHHDTFHISLK
jgi:hypothetical protein